MSFMGRVTYAPGGSGFFTVDSYRHVTNGVAFDVIPFGRSNGDWYEPASPINLRVSNPYRSYQKNEPELAQCQYCNQWTPKKAHCQHCGGPYVEKMANSLTNVYTNAVKATWTDEPDAYASQTKGYDPEVLRRYNAEKRPGLLEKVIDLFK